jgi:ribose transport system permease protein
MNSLLKKLSSFREATLLLTIIAISVMMTFLSPAFLSVENLRTTAIGLATDGIVVTGMTVAIISGGFDLSVGSILGLAGVVAGKCFLSGMNIWAAALIGILAAVLCGVINGLFIGKVGLNPFITTLGMMGMARGACMIITQGSPLSLRKLSTGFEMLGRGSVLGIPVIVIFFIVIAMIGDFLLRNTAPMRKVFYAGSNEKAAVLSGIDVSKVKIGVFTLTAFLAGVAGVLSIARFGVATPTAGVGGEMTAISAAVIGGSSLNGGEGSIFGAVLGVILLALISNALVLLDVSVYWQQLISGMILIAAVTLDHVSRKRNAKKA